MSQQFSRSTPSTGNNAPTEPERQIPPARETLFSFSPAQILGGALAAMTAAALGSRLGVAGTIVGAALASIIAAVAGSLYTASIRASQQRVATVLSRTRSPRSPAPTITESFEVPAAEIAEQKRDARQGWWKGAALGAIAAFALAAVILTSFELFTGNAISGGDGTTITQVGRDVSGGSGGDVDTTPTATTTETVTRSAEPSASSTASSASSRPSSSETPPATPSTSPSETPSGSPTTSETPSSSTTASATPSSGSDATTEAGTTAEGISQP